jgi:hypothetical protein
MESSSEDESYQLKQMRKNFNRGKRVVDEKYIEIGKLFYYIKLRIGCTYIERGNHSFSLGLESVRKKID